MVKQADYVPYSSKRKKFIEALHCWILQTLSSTSHLIIAGSNSIEMYLEFYVIGGVLGQY